MGGPIHMPGIESHNSNRGKKMSQAQISPDSELAAGNRRQAIVACVDPEIRQRLLSVLNEFRLDPVLLETPDDAKVLLGQDETAVAFVQPRFSDGNFHEILRAANGPGSRVPVIVCSEYYDKELYIEAMSLGAFDYLAFPYRREDVAWVIHNAVSRVSPT
jgi:DNA-binding NtrC family response regulator